MTAFETAKTIIERLVSCGYSAYIAGGWVRDFLMNHPSDDIDIATDAPVEEIQNIFTKTIPVGVNFGIVVVVESDHQFEVATLRKDEGYLDGRRPTGIQPATAQEDAQRRDFTINGMFYDPLTETIYDYVGGQQDLKEGLIRAIGNPHERFLEDRLRMIRAVRYSTRFHFPIETATMEAIIEHAPQLFPAVAYERVWQEFVKMNRFAHFDLCLITLHRLRLLPTIFPDLAQTPTEEIQSRLRHLENFPSSAPPIIKLLELFPNAPLNDQLQICQMFRLSRKEQDFVLFYNQVAQAAEPKMPHSELDLFDWAKLYAHHDFTLCLQILAARLPKNEREALYEEHETRIKHLSETIERIKNKSPIIRSHDLQDQGVKPGRNMGKLLEQAERLAANEALHDPCEILKRLRESPDWPT